MEFTVPKNSDFSNSDSIASSPSKWSNLPIIFATVVLGCNFLTHLTSFVPIFVGTLLACIIYDKKANNRWLYIGFTAFFAIIGYFLLDNTAAHAFFLNNVEAYAKTSFVAAGATNTQVNTALTIGFGLIRVVALGLVFGGVWQGYNNFRGGQELSSIVMPPASAVGLIVVTQAISSMMMTSST